jgi:ATP-dependent Clp protease protease subunit
MAECQVRVPIVIEKEGRTEMVYDIYSRLLKDRIVFCTGSIGDDLANTVVAQMLFLSNQDPKADIHFYINSPGGSISAGLAIYDTMQYLRCPVATYCIGLAASMAAVLLAGGASDKRFVLPNSRTLLHQPLLGGVLQGPATDLSIEAQEILRLRQNLYEILHRHSGKDVDQIVRDCDRNRWLNAEESLDYGLADRILERMPDLPRAGEKD